MENWQELKINDTEAHPLQRSIHLAFGYVQDEQVDSKSRNQFLKTRHLLVIVSSMEIGETISSRETANGGDLIQVHDNQEY